jgi:hypothetical protein
MESSDLEQLLNKLIAQHLRQAQQAAQPAASAPSPPPNLGLPTWPAAAWPQPQPQPMAPATSTTYQPIGVSVPVQVPLPDGRRVSMRVHFGPEAAQNLPALATHCLTIFGQYLAVQQPRAWTGGWNGQNGYGHNYRNGRWSR